MLVDELDAPGGVVDGRLDLPAVSHDRRVAEQPLDVRGAEAGHGTEVEAGECTAEPLALAEDRQPAEPGLEPLQAQLLEQAHVVVDGEAPLRVVVADVVRRARHRPRSSAPRRRLRRESRPPGARSSPGHSPSHAANVSVWVPAWKRPAQAWQDRAMLTARSHRRPADVRRASARVARRPRERAQELSYPEGAEVVGKDDHAYHLFVIEEGTVEVSRKPRACSPSSAPATSSARSALLVTGKRTASVVATSPLRVIALFDRDVRSLQERATRRSSRSSAPR